MKRPALLAALLLAVGAVALAGGLVPSSGGGHGSSTEFADGGVINGNLVVRGAVSAYSFSLLDGGAAGVGGSPIWSSTGPAWPAGYAIPLSTTSFCVSVDVAPTIDWALGTIGPAGIFQMGATYANANTLSVYYTVVGKSGDTVVAQYYGPNGVQYARQANASVFVNYKHRISVCKSGPSLRIYDDGVQTGLDLAVPEWSTVPTTLRIGDLGAGNFTMPSTTATFTYACVSGGTGAFTGITATDVSLGCSETTPLYGPPCYGCIATPSGGKVLAMGDSITEGSVGPLPRTYPAKLQALTRLPVTNVGTSGSHCYQKKTDWEAYHSDGGYAVVAVLCGINDFNDGASAASVWTPLSGLYDEIRASGAKLVPMTVDPYDGLSAGLQTQLQTLNASISAYASDAGIPFVDTYSLLADGGSTLWSGYWSTDHLHPNQIGSDVMAVGVCRAMVDGGWADGGCP